MKNLNFARNIFAIASLLLGSAALPSAAVASEPVSQPEIKHVVLIGLDGWGAYSTEKADMPNVKNLIKEGSYTNKKRSVLPSSSAPNWAAMFMGAPTELHGYTKWGSKTPEIPSPTVNNHGIFPTIFSVLREAKPEAEIGVLYEWDGIKHLVDTLALSHHEQAIPTKDVPDTLCTVAENYILEKKPALVAICFDEPDHTGHAAGHDTPEYYSILTRQDGYVGRIMEAVKRAGIWDDTVIIVTADHGGIGKDHGGITLMEMETPFIVAGKGIKQGHEIKEIMMQYDVAATIARLFGIEQPQAWTGRPMTEIIEVE